MYAYMLILNVVGDMTSASNKRAGVRVVCRVRVCQLAPIAPSRAQISVPRTSQPRLMGGALKNYEAPSAQAESAVRHCWGLFRWTYRVLAVGSTEAADPSGRSPRRRGLRGWRPRTRLGLRALPGGSAASTAPREWGVPRALLGGFIATAPRRCGQVRL